MSPLQTAVKQILALPSAQRQPYVRALFLSLIGDPDNSIPMPKNATEIQDETGLNAKTLFDRFIVLDFKRSVEFLISIDRKLSEATFRKMAAEEKYKELFKNRSLPRKGNMFLFTYAEVQYLAEHTVNVQFPNELWLHLNSEDRGRWEEWIQSSSDENDQNDP